MAMMYLSGNGVKLTIPVLPQTIKVSNSANNSSQNVVSIGEITLKQGRKEQQISFSSFFPANGFKGCLDSSDFLTPKAYVNQIEKWINDKQTVRFTLSRKESEYKTISIDCTIEKFDWNEDGGDVGTIQYSITLKEYRKITVNKLEVKNKKATTKKSSKRSTSSKKSSSTYTVKKGDCLWNIAKAKLGSGSKWKKIYNDNKSVIEKAAKKHGYKSSSNGHWIFPGTVLKINK